MAGLYRSEDGYHEIPTTTRLNGLGEKVVQAGGVYNGHGQPYSYVSTGGNTGFAIRPNTGLTLTTPSVGGYGTTGVSSSAGSGTGGGGGLNYIVNGKITKDPFAAQNTPSAKAERAYGDALATLQGGLSDAKAAAAQSAARITNGARDLDAARGAAGDVGAAITNINATASRLNPYEMVFAGQGQNLLDQFRALMSGDASVGGAIGDYLTSTRDAASALDAINPDAYAAMAGADVQSQFDSARGQNERELSRRGVSLGSGAQAALLNQFNRSLATAKAAAMTRGRLQGVTDRANAQAQKQALFKDVLQTADTQSDKGLQATDYASQIVQKQGDLFKISGDLSNTKGSLFVNIGGEEVSFGSAELANAKLIQDAIGDYADELENMAGFYKDTMDVTTSETKDAHGYENDVITTSTRTYS